MLSCLAEIIKRCPECGRDYNDDSLSFCLDDGSELLFGPKSFDEPQTAILNGTPNSAEAATAVLLTSSSSSDSVRNSIAVLPFANISADEENEYFCDGLAEELLNALSKIQELKVAARTSAFSFKGKNAEAREIGKAAAAKTVGDLKAKMKLLIKTQSDATK
ncbi:MAG: hypothetical protein IPM25_06645 [Chloracidobacterium sp.]|nr:hypothetical protein [Chloracidobacterium sp.]